MTDKKNFTRRIGLASAAIVGCAVVAGVAAPAMAAPAPAAASAAPAAAAPAAQVREVNDPVKAFQGRVILNVKNTTDQKIHVTMNGKSISGVVEKDLAPGESLRAAGHTLASSQDVSGSIRYASGSTVDFWGYNPEFGYPSVGFGDGSNWERFYVDETHNFTEAGHDFTVKRSGDVTGGKDFHIDVK